jgi:hypothetical protein
VASVVVVGAVVVVEVVVVVVVGTVAVVVVVVELAVVLDVVVVVVDVVVVVVEVVVVVVVLVGVSPPATELTQSLMTGSRLAASLALEQSVADASLPIAALNLISASARQSEGSFPFSACFDRQVSFADAFLAIAATFFESHLLFAGAVSLLPTAEIAVLSHVSRSARTVLALPGHELLASAFAKPFERLASGFASQEAPPPGVPLASALESHLSALESVLPEAVSLAPVHLSARAGAGGARNAATSTDTSAGRIECMSGWPPFDCASGTARSSRR